MQEDMHFYGTYAMARAAGIPQSDSEVIAYAAQFVDDSTKQDSEQHKDGGLLYGIATAHHSMSAVKNAAINREEQRRVWVPFHFLPGGEGESLEEKILCVKDSPIAREMIAHHVGYALQKSRFGLELLGIMAHVYMDTFSHYGFSGISSDFNEVDGKSFQFIQLKDPEIKAYIERKKAGFMDKYIPSRVQSFFGETLSRGLGHGAVATYPDRPFLHWQVEFERPRPGSGTHSDRNNPKTFLEGCGQLHQYFAEFAKQRYADAPTVDFAKIRSTVDTILRFEGKKQSRIEQWCKAFHEKSLFESEEKDKKIHYDPKLWEGEKKQFHNLTSSSHGLEQHAYRFHQAAAQHRYYILKELLPKHSIAVY